MKNVNFQCSLSKMSQKTSVERSISILKEKEKIHFEQTISGGKKHLHTPRMTTDNHIYCWDGRLCEGLSHYSRTMKSLDTQFC